MRPAVSLALLLLHVQPMAAQSIVVDGALDAAYGSALSIQKTNTSFGNANSGDAVNGGEGSEIDGAFMAIEDGKLFVMLTGNLQPNRNKMEIFLDTEPGGVNEIVGAALPSGVDPFCCGGFAPPDGPNVGNVGALQRMNGLKFDAGFEADHYLTISHGFETGLDDPNSPGDPISFWALSAHYADLTDGAQGSTAALGAQFAHRGQPNVLRGTTADTDIDGAVGGSEFLIW